MSRKESLIRGALALALAGLIIKISNLLIRLPLTRLIGSEGLGIYQMALPAFNALFHLAAGGVPVAVQNLVAEQMERRRRAAADRALRLALTYAWLAGGAATCLLLAGAPILARLLGDYRAYQPLVAIAPAVLILAVDSVYRSYLQGRKMMTPSATASVLEQATKLVVTLGAAWLLLPMGREYGAAGAALGITAGAAASLVYIYRAVRRVRAEDAADPAEDVRPTGLVRSVGLGRRMLRLAWPVTLGSITMPLLNVLDVGVVQTGFRKAGYALAEATALYGAYAGIAVQVVWFPFVLTNALANATVPTLTAAQARGDMAAVHARVVMGLRTAALICLPVAMGVMVLSAPIVALFGEPQAAVPLRYLGPVALLGPLAWMTVAQLQALGVTGVPMRNLTLGMMVKLGLDALLAPIRGVDVKGVALASVTMFLVATWLNSRALERVLPEPIPWGRILAGPLAASLVMGGGLAALAYAAWEGAGPNQALMVAMLLAPLLYGGTLVATRSLTRTELLALAGPLAPRLERLLSLIWPWS